jgi:hypothetical protein
MILTLGISNLPGLCGQEEEQRDALDLARMIVGAFQPATANPSQMVTFSFLTDLSQLMTGEARLDGQVRLSWR